MHAPSPEGTYSAVELLGRASVMAVKIGLPDKGRQVQGPELEGGESARAGSRGASRTRACREEPGGSTGRPTRSNQEIQDRFNQRACRPTAGDWVDRAPHGQPGNIIQP